MRHIVLLGDSILDNAAYTYGGPDVAAQLHRLLTAGDFVTLLATDGDMTINIARQLKQLPPDATHLVLSVGGNDALMNSDFLMEEANPVAEVLPKSRAIADAFGLAHGEAMKLIENTGLPLIVCTIYDANFADPQTAQLVATALALFNESITRNAVEFGAPLVDLRLVCSESADYANEIEPSVQGSGKIARALWRALESHNWESKRATIYI